MERYLTKTRFKQATECPTKLFYTKKEKEYADQSREDSFLAALAEGGYQVGELAKAYHPDGHDIKSLDLEQSVAETNRLLEQDNVTIFEAAVRYKNLFIRIDVLRKQGNVFDLVEVKAKSFDGETEFVDTRSGKVTTKWFPYLIDVAFQEYVLRKAFPKSIIRPVLMLADKNAKSSADGLNQKFKIIKLDGNKQTQRVGDVSLAALGSKILLEVDVREYVKMLQSETYEVGRRTFDFEGYVEFLSAQYAANQKIPPVINCGTCADCEFQATQADEAKGLKSGYKECWKEALNFTEQDFNTPSVMGLWNFSKKQECLETNRFFLRNLSESDFNLEKPMPSRQWLQVQKAVSGDASPWVDISGLKNAFAEWVWPLHFIDFETSAVAVPFNKGRHPYEVVVFQFSHHIAYKDGRIEHADEYLNTAQGVFPNFDFVRALKAVLEKDKGTIFRYATHENSVLNQIADQLSDAADVPDRLELIEWIKSITNNKKTGWVGPRDMVDLCELVKKHYYQLDMGGSNSIKKVLPAILNSSEYLQKKYSKPVYTTRNYTNQVWIQKDADGRVKDPYKLLPPVFADIPQDELDKKPADNNLADGGAAMTAYARIQFSNVLEAERQATCKALLRYCELDTLAMVMIWEDWAGRLGFIG
jgi:hypothetical protein